VQNLGPDISTTKLGRAGRHTVTAADKAQAREVSLRRIARLFIPHRWSIATVTAIIVVSSVVAMASPFLLRAVIDDALPHQNLTLLVWLVIGMVAVATRRCRARPLVVDDVAASELEESLPGWAGGIRQHPHGVAWYSSRLRRRSQHG
jgi:hypothetical protein